MRQKIIMLAEQHSMFGWKGVCIYSRMLCRSLIWVRTPCLNNFVWRTSLAGLNYPWYLRWIRESNKRSITQFNAILNQDLLASMSQLMDQKIGALKWSSEESSRQQLDEIKKMKLGQSIDFTKKANKDQYLHNASYKLSNLLKWSLKIRISKVL